MEESEKKDTHEKVNKEKQESSEHHKEHKEHSHHKKAENKPEHKEHKEHKNEHEHKEHDHAKEHLVHKEKAKSHHHVHHHRKDVKTRIKMRLLKARRDKNLFLGTTIIFLTLFLVTLFYNPTTIDLDSNIDGLNSFVTTLDSDAAKTAINNAITELEVAKEIIQPEEDTTSVSGDENEDNTTTTNTEPVVVNEGDLVMTVLNDARCKTCDVTALKARLQEVFPTIKFQDVDYTTDQGKAMFQDLGLTFLPAMLFNEQVVTEDNYAEVANFLEQTGDYYNLNIGSSFDPTKEICDNGVDDTGNELVDCEDETCANSFECRPLKENHVSVFIMSDCPYGREAVKALGPVIEAVPELDYEINYIVTDLGEGNFNSLHGAYEVEENIRQLCAKDLSEEDHFNYVLCRSENGVKDVDWKDCAEENNYDLDALEACTTGDKGTELLTENAVIANDLGIGASPTWLSNNRYQFSGITSDVVLANVCSANPTLEGCDTELSGEAAVPAGQC